MAEIVAENHWHTTRTRCADFQGAHGGTRRGAQGFVELGLAGVVLPLAKCT